MRHGHRFRTPIRNHHRKRAKRRLPSEGSKKEACFAVMEKADYFNPSMSSFDHLSDGAKIRTIQENRVNRA